MAATCLLLALSTVEISENSSNLYSQDKRKRKVCKVLRSRSLRRYRLHITPHPTDKRSENSGPPQSLSRRSSRLFPKKNGGQAIDIQQQSTDLCKHNMTESLQKQQTAFSRSPDCKEVDELGVPADGRHVFPLGSLRVELPEGEARALPVAEGIAGVLPVLEVLGDVVERVLVNHALHHLRLRGRFGSLVANRVDRKPPCCYGCTAVWMISCRDLALVSVLGI
jgi:hypothetical protein